MRCWSKVGEVVIIATKHTVGLALEETGQRSCQSGHPLRLVLQIFQKLKNGGRKGKYEREIQEW
jgi:hypothetical protein